LTFKKKDCWPTNGIECGFKKEHHF